LDNAEKKFILRAALMVKINLITAQTPAELG